MPVYTKLLAKPPGVARTINIALIWITWFLQTSFMLIVMLNFLIAVITDNYSRVFKLQQTYGYYHKA